MSDINKNNPIDLGSVPTDDFDPFASDDDLDDGITAEETADMPTTQTEKTEAQTTAPGKPNAATVSEAETDSEDADESDNPLISAIDAAETKDAEKAKQSLYEKLPVFEYAGATEDIADSSQTFDELRIAKAVDFPEPEDGKRVSWTIEYGKITKDVTDAKGTSIAKMKSEIETSKAFTDALKKAKDKNPACKVKPKVKAQSKGVATASSGYKGIFTCMDDVEAAGKVISILPAKDGNVYEIRNTAMGTFTTLISGDNLLSNVKAGFARALPLIPRELLLQIVAFFRYFSCNTNSEALLNIYWDKANDEYIVDAPEQIVSKASVKSQISDKYADDGRYIHYMDIHSHNTMKAFFSAVDNADEKATRLYTVVGDLHKGIPDIKTRISNGGKFLEINPGEVFEPIGADFPDEWRDAVKFRKSHGENKDDITNALFDNALFPVKEE